MEVVQRSLKKCFDGIHRLVFAEGGRTVTSLLSPEGEELRLLKPLTTKSEVEQWLGLLQEDMKDTVHKLLKKGRQEYENSERGQWVLANPAQVVQTVSQLM